MATTIRDVDSTIASSGQVRYIEDEATWNQTTDALGGSLLQCWKWGEFKALHGWQPFRLLVEVGGEPVGAAQVLSKSMGPLAVLYVPRGPMLGTSNPVVLSTLTLAIDRLAKRERAAIAFIEPDSPSGHALPSHGALSWTASDVELQPLRTIKVRVDRNDDEILAGMKNKSRYNVRLAGRRGVTVRQGQITEVAAFYELLQETSERDAFGIHSVEYYADMLEIFGEQSALLIAEHDGEIAAGAIIVQRGDEAIYMFGASSRAHQRHMPTHLLQFEAMRWARERGCTWYDLWGIPPTDEAPDEAANGDLNVRSGLWGVYRFKQGFGGEIVSYPGVFERQYYPKLIGLWRRFRSGPGA